jgi:hypothetical protein
MEGEAQAGLLGSVGLRIRTFEQSLRFRSGRSTQPFVGDRVWLGKLNSYFPQELAGMTGRYQSQTLVEEVASLQACNGNEACMSGGLKMESLIANQGANIVCLARRPLLF